MKKVNGGHNGASACKCGKENAGKVIVPEVVTESTGSAGGLDRARRRVGAYQTKGALRPPFLTKATIEANRVE